MSDHLDMLRNYAKERRRLAEQEAFSRFNAVHHALLEGEAGPDWEVVRREAGRLQRIAYKLARGE